MLLIFHKSLMVLGTLCIITGVSAAVFFRQSLYWLKVHKAFNSIASIFLSTGIVMAITAVWQQKGEHLDGSHPILGIITLGFIIISLFLGYYQFHANNRIQVFKILHRWLGRPSLLFVIAALISGLVRAGIM
jgi:exosortase/archaeosortase